MNTLRVLWRSTVGKKAVMALTGVLLFGWLLLHVAGNLLVFASASGPALATQPAATALPGYGSGSIAVSVPPIDSYAQALHSRPWLLWPMRLGLIMIVGLHIAAAVPLAQRARRARGLRPITRRPEAATLAAHTLRIGGVLLAGFMVFHVLHLTIGTLHPAFIAGSVHHNLVSALRVPAVSAIYLGAVTILALHLAHGLFSAQRSLGLISDSASEPRRLFSRSVALLVWAGFGAIPLAAWCGVLR